VQVSGVVVTQLALDVLHQRLAELLAAQTPAAPNAFNGASSVSSESGRC